MYFQHRYRSLIRNRADFAGLRVDDEGWIVPVLSGNPTPTTIRKLNQIARFEFNSHP